MFPLANSESTFKVRVPSHPWMKLAAKLRLPLKERGVALGELSFLQARVYKRGKIFDAPRCVRNECYLFGGLSEVKFNAKSLTNFREDCIFVALFSEYPIRTDIYKDQP